MTADRPEAPRLAEIRRRFNGPTIPMPQEDVVYLLSVAEAAAALLDALRAFRDDDVATDADIGTAIEAWVNDDPIDPTETVAERVIQDRLVSLQNALEGG